jgi:hypothetical protein
MPPCTFPLCLRVRWQSQTWLINGVASHRLSTRITIYALRIDMLPNCCVWLDFNFSLTISFVKTDMRMP